MNQLTIEKYAQVLIKVGVNLQAGQYLILQTSTDALPLARAVTQAAFEAGAKDVIVIMEDTEIKRLRAMHASSEVLREVPDYQKEQLDYYLRQDSCQLGLMGTYPSLFADVEQEKALALSAHDNEVRNVIRQYIHAGTLQWTGTCVANMDWAKRVYEELPEEQALAQLEADLAKMMRVDQADPVSAWEAHCKRLGAISAKLNQYQFESLHITTGLGTDITMKLVEGHIWLSAADMGSSLVKVPYVANMPTEEIFTDPHRLSVNGVAVASRPLMMSGKLVTNFQITFQDGLAVDCKAESNVDILKNALFHDEHTRQLGEVALVSKNSMITKMNRIYYNGLIDENAASHLAFGTSFPSNIQNGTSMSKEELLAHGVNVAVSHNDFMIGTEDMKAVGITHDHKQVVIMENGDFVI